jgi:putative transposase
MLGYTKQAYYKRQSLMEATFMNEELILELVERKRKIWKKGSGRNLFAALKTDFEEHSIKIGRDKFFDLLRVNNLLKTTKKRTARTTFSYHFFHKYPNMIKDKIPLKGGEIIVSDITYIWIKDIENFAYLFLTTDLYSRKIIGYCLSDSLKAKSALKALEMAMKQISREGCIHHSDRGIQYCCNDYTNLLVKNKMLISMTENGDPLENAVAERVNRTIKEEFTDEKTLCFESLKIGLKKIPEFVKFYNEEGPHRSIDMLTPQQAFTMTGELKKHWKNYYRKSENEILKQGEFLKA